MPFLRQRFARCVSRALFAGCLAQAALVAGQPNAGNGEAFKVGVRRFAEAAIQLQVEAPAGVRSLNETRIAAEVPATVVEIPARVGATLARGAVVARLDPRDYELAVRRAEANLESSRARLRLAESQLARTRELAKQNFISSEALNQRETEVEVVRAELRLQETQLEGARRDLDKTVLRAPFQAIVKERLAGVGELAQPGTPLVTLLDAGRTEVVAAVQVKDAPSLRAVSAVRFVGLDGTYPVALARLSPAIERESRTVEARLVFTGRQAAIGTVGRIVWNDPRPFLPAELLVRREGRLGVFVIEGQLARFIPLPEAQEGRPAAADLAPSTLIVTDGQRGLRHGQQVVAAPTAGSSR